MKKFIGILLELLCGPIEILLFMVLEKVPFLQATGFLKSMLILAGGVVVLIAYTILYSMLVYRISDREKNYFAVLSTFVMYVVAFHFWEETKLSMVASVIVAIIIELVQFGILMKLQGSPKKSPIEKMAKKGFDWNTGKKETQVYDEFGNYKGKATTYEGDIRSTTYFEDEYGRNKGQAETYDEELSSTTYYTDEYGKSTGETKRIK